MYRITNKVNGISYGEHGRIYWPGETAPLDEWPEDERAKLVAQGLIEPLAAPPEPPRPLRRVKGTEEDKTE